MQRSDIQPRQECFERNFHVSFINWMDSNQRSQRSVQGGQISQNDGRSLAVLTPGELGGAEKRKIDKLIELFQKCSKQAETISEFRTSEINKSEKHRSEGGIKYNFIVLSGQNGYLAKIENIIKERNIYDVKKQYELYKVLQHVEYIECFVSLLNSYSKNYNGSPFRSDKDIKPICNFLTSTSNKIVKIQEAIAVSRKKMSENNFIIKFWFDKSNLEIMDKMNLELIRVVLKITEVLSNLNL